MSQSKKPRVAVTKDSRGHIHIRLNAGLKATLGRGGVKATDAGYSLSRAETEKKIKNLKADLERAEANGDQRQIRQLKGDIEHYQNNLNDMNRRSDEDAAPPKKPDEGGRYNAEAVQKEINKDPTALTASQKTRLAELEEKAKSDMMSPSDREHLVRLRKLKKAYGDTKDAKGCGCKK